MEWLQIRIDDMHPRDLDVPDLIELINDAYTLIYPNPKTKKQKVSVDITDCCVLLDLKTDDSKAIKDMQDALNAANSSRNLDILPPRFKSALLRLKEKTKDLQRPLLINTSQGHPDKPFFLDKNTLIQPENNFWFKTKAYLYGIVLTAGGKTPNIHLETKNKGTVIISAPYNVLASAKKNLLYKRVGIKASLEQHLNTGEVRNAQFLEFLPYSLDEGPVSSSETSAFDDVKDPAQWVRSIRGTV